MADFPSVLRALDQRAPVHKAPVAAPSLPIEITVEAPPAPDVTVNVPATEPQSYRVRVTERNNDGMIVEFLVEPVQVI